MQYKRMITGAAGFVGAHLCERVVLANEASVSATLDLLPLPGRAEGPAHRQADIRDLDTMVALASDCPTPTLLHLAAMAEVVMPFERMGDLVETNIQGTVNLLDAFAPQRIVFASSSAVYGSVHGRAVRPLPGETAAIGAYGVSKLMSEVICSEWAAAQSSNSVALRFGNVVGPGCRGLIPYLVSHALRYPAGEVVAQLRGQGRIIRDYFSVERAVDSILQAAELSLQPGESAVFNIGSGIGTTNREVTAIVVEVLQQQGYRLATNFDNPIPAGESESIVLDVSETTSRLGVQPSTAAELRDSIEQATCWHLARLLEEKSGSNNS